MKIVLMGNAGSGKSTLARRMIQERSAAASRRMEGGTTASAGGLPVAAPPVALLALDDIAWETPTPTADGGAGEDGSEPDPLAAGVIPARRPLAASIALLETFLRTHSHWIIEGCYGDLIAAALPACEELIFLNPGVAACVAHCRARPWEPAKFPTPEAQEAMLDGLVTWVRQYESRDDEFGLRRHRALFDAFPATKRECTDPAQYGDGCR